MLKAEDCPGAFLNLAITCLDLRLNYQYRAFGVPGLGLKRGSGRRFSNCFHMPALLALMVMPEESCANLAKLACHRWIL